MLTTHINSVNMTDIVSLDGLNLNISSQYNIKKATPKNHARNQQKVKYAYWKNAKATGMNVLIVLRIDLN